MNVEGKVLIFDLDDTLLECNANYCKIIADFVNRMVHEFDTKVPHPVDITATQTRIDQELIQDQDFTKDRFPLSLVLTYKFFHDKLFPEEPYNDDFIDEVYKLGYTIFDIIPRELPNAYNLLNRLNKNNIPIYMLTAGDEEPQKYKIYSTMVKKFFKPENIFINKRKGVDEFNVVLDKIRKDNPGIENKDVVMIGDSLKNDIAPALELGLEAIHLDVASWGYNYVEIDIPHYSLQNLYELEDYLF